MLLLLIVVVCSWLSATLVWALTRSEYRWQSGRSSPLRYLRLLISELSGRSQNLFCRTKEQ